MDVQVLPAQQFFLSVYTTHFKETSWESQIDSTKVLQTGLKGAGGNLLNKNWFLSETSLSITNQSTVVKV